MRRPYFWKFRNPFSSERDLKTGTIKKIITISEECRVLKHGMEEIYIYITVRPSLNSTGAPVTRTAVVWRVTSAKWMED